MTFIRNLFVGGFILSQLLSLGGCGIFQEPEFSPSQENRFFVAEWDAGPYALPGGWGEVTPLTLLQLKQLCSKQVCYLYKEYIPKGSKKISKEIYKPSSDFANLLEVSTEQLNHIDPNILILDLRYSTNKQEVTPLTLLQLKQLCSKQVCYLY